MTETGDFRRLNPFKRLSVTASPYDRFEEVGSPKLEELQAEADDG